MMWKATSLPSIVSLDSKQFQTKSKKNLALLLLKAAKIETLKLNWPFNIEVNAYIYYEVTIIYFIFIQML